MTTQVKCRRCAECRDNSHHWIPNINFGVKVSASEWICKHCPAKGEECILCCGDGSALEGGLCVLCRGEGVLPSAMHRKIKAASAKAVRTIIEHSDTWEEEAGHASQVHQTPEAGAFHLESRMRVVIEIAICECLSRGAIK